MKNFILYIITIIFFYSQLSHSQNISGDTACFKTIHRNVHKAIPDITGNNNPALDTIEFSGINSSQTIDVILTIDSITHTWVGDLVIALVKDTTSDTVLSRIGRTGGIGFGLPCNNLIGTKLSDTATVSVQSMTCSTSAGNANSTGSFRPKYPLQIFRQSNVNPNGKWILKIYDWGGGDTGTLRAWSLKIQVCVPNEISNNTQLVPAEFKLYQNFPDPFNPSTTISYFLPKESLIKLDVYDAVGRKVRILINERQPAGAYKILFDAENLVSGVYYYTLHSNGDFIGVRKMIFLK